ncbi:hypothetical protein B5807_01791 [Epicoccum nigrum]|uniref:N-acetyltransferase domain-containing protein n=1 Tax=Epicoccum nigrum TaxID=105696 RepID=A0A1Y2MH72_EPING|nr:hypothetical protein B5807_01791 [Epicoccum nigrum]
MDPVLTTPRLKLTLLTHAEKGSEEFSWLHQLRSDKQAQFWSLHGPSATVQDTEKAAQHFLPSASHPLRIAYAIHDPSLPCDQSQFIGLITLHPLVPGAFLPLPAHLAPPPENKEGTLVTELAYALLPAAWGKGFATEALGAVLDALEANAGN